MQTKEQLLMVHRGTLEHLQKQLAACTVTAPTDGIVVYGSSVQSMFYRETPIQPGPKVMEQQLVVRLPDTGAMKAVAKIPEHQGAPRGAAGREQRARRAAARGWPRRGAGPCAR